MDSVETRSTKGLAGDVAEWEEGVQEVKVVHTTVIETEVTVVGDVGTVERDVLIEDGGGGEREDSGFAVEENGGKGAKENMLGGGNGEGEAEGSVVVQESGVVCEKGVTKQNGGSLGDDGEIEVMSEEEDGEGEGGVVTDRGDKFEVGDFVWGKIKSHPWWPGVVYDEKDASEFAAKKKPANRILVGYFGDGTFSWCNPSQLKPFVENFERLSKMSQLKNFVNALQDALDVIGRLVELQFDHSLPEEKRRGLDRPLANNTGIKEDVLVPENGIHKFSFLQYDANSLLADLKSLARHSLPGLNGLELTILKSWLSAFYHAKGGYRLPSYVAPQPILGLEDKAKSEGKKKRESDLSVDPPVRGSIDDWQSSPSQSALNKLAENSDGKSSQKRKKKSIADILRDNTDGNRASSIGIRKRKASIDVSDKLNSPSSFSKPKRRKTTQSETSNIDGVGSLDKEDQAVDKSKQETDDGSISAKKTMIRVLNIRSEDNEDIELTDSGSHSREKRKSKYLSPPFTSPSQSDKKKVSEAESMRASSKSRLSEKMTRAASSLMNGSSALKNDNEAGQRKHAQMETVSYPTTPKQSEGTINPLNIQVSANEVLSGVLSVARDPTCIGGDNNALGFVKEYLSLFRNSVYCDEKVQKSQAGRKRKAADAETGGIKSIQKGNLLKSKEGEVSFPYDDVVKEKIDLISSMVETLDCENVLELKTKLSVEIGAVKERVAALAGPLS